MKMKALVLEQYNSPFQLKEVTRPVAGNGQVLVRIKASGINPLDLKIKAGQAAHAETELPAILGLDMAGVVESVGDGVTAFKAGDEVYGMIGGVGGVQGSLAEFAAVDADLLAIKPRNLSMREAASLPLVFITAWEGLVDRAKVGQGKTVLIHGGAGGVGNIAIQIAKAKGAEVFTTIESEDEGLIKEYGATPINYKKTTLQDYLIEHSSGLGFDIVFDTVGGSVLDDSFKSIKRYTGHVLTTLGWGNHSLAPLSFRGATYSGVFALYPLISGEDRAHHGEILKAATLLIENGRVKPLVSPQLYTLETISEAYNVIETRSAKGRLVIDIE